MNANHEHFLSEQNNFANMAKAYKNNPEFKEAVDKDPRFLIDGEFDGELKVVWNDEVNYYLIIPADPNGAIDDEDLGIAGANAKIQIALKGEVEYFRDTSNGSTYISGTKNGISLGKPFYHVDANGYQDGGVKLSYDGSAGRVGLTQIDNPF